MTLGDTVFGVLLAVCFIGCILFVIFGQVTVRKLRKNPETKQALGIEFSSGWDILNVAQALSLPAVLEKRLKNRAFHANADLLHKHTTVFDRILAQLFFWSWMSSGFGMIVFTLVYFLFDLGQN